jgi:hypothetical protein
MEFSSKYMGLLSQVSRKIFRYRILLETQIVSPSEGGIVEENEFGQLSLSCYLSIIAHGG